MKHESVIQRRYRRYFVRARHPRILPRTRIIRFTVLFGWYHRY